MAQLIDLTGLRFSRLVAISLYCKGKTSKWNCLCDCGNITIVTSQNLRKGHTRSCGCYNSELTAMRNIRHGQSNTRLYKIWKGVVRRCYNKKAEKYPNYGGRGITVCQEWKNNFMMFYDWAISHDYSDNLSIDRIDNDGNYCPENCRWVTNKVQARNKTTSKHLTVGGITRTISEWSEITGIKYHTLEGRVKRKWHPEKIIGTAVNMSTRYTKV